ncbi:MAG TPA: hypothetical protein DDW94_11205 [Deltaproteobacteria bacterium]|nr:MAG: hypothetical protein A2Z79_04765 [Deltaproteobacteria bacterium GWA2_55_82]OIJ72637.1 MAG: hypothetical protein A2V21_312335 [Deltaproteobacteria bacterium GWC2_55_46]HBG47538.1 hypothetical protein [Deltaproteobacteria bacterium]HCY10449.1 hypothetical protein [Deltaproteobacteria bacterium]
MAEESRDNRQSKLIPFKVIGSYAHQRPKKRLDLSRVIYARDAVHAMEIYRKELRGVKKRGLIQVVPL